MKRLLILWSVTGLFLACEKSDDDGPISTFIWTPNISVNLDDGRATLYLSDPRPYTLYAAPGPENPAYFEVLISGDSERFDLYKRLDSFTDSLEIENLTNGKNYYFKVNAYRKGFEMAPSNLVATIPNVRPKQESYPLGLDISVERMAFSKDYGYMTFYSRDYMGGGMSADLLLRDKTTGEISSLGYFSNSPSWSTQENNLVYLTSTLAGNVVYSDKIVLYNADDKTNQELLAFDYNEYYINEVKFTLDDNAVSYLSTKGLTDGRYDLWSLNLDSTEESRISDFEALDFQTGGGYLWVNEKEIYLGGVLGSDNYIEDIFKYNIATKALQAVIQSRWRDSRPSLSPNNARLAFLSDRAGYFHQDIWLYDLNTSEYRRLTGNGPENGFSSPYSSLIWLNDTKLLVTLYNPASQRMRAYTLEIN